MNGGQDEKLEKLKHKSTFLRSGTRSDFKIKKSAALDVTAILVSVAAAFLVWVFTGTL